MVRRALTDALESKAKAEINEVPERTSSDIESFRGWITKQPHLNAKTSDQFLLAFLRGCKFSIEKAKQKFDYYYSIRTISPEIFHRGRVDENFLNFLRLGSVLRLPKPLTVDGPRIHMSRYNAYNPKIHHISDQFKTWFKIAEIQMENDDNVMVNGYIEILDLEGITLGHILQCDVAVLKKVLVFTQKAVPLRIHGFHFINAPKEAMPIINIAMSLMGDKIKKRFHIHKSLESLYEVIPKKLLPTEYGGDNGNIPQILNYWENELKRNNDRFEEELHHGTDEKKRIGRVLNSESLYGLEGSFRKLEVD